MTDQWVELYLLLIECSRPAVSKCVGPTNLHFVFLENILLLQFCNLAFLLLTFCA